MPDRLPPHLQPLTAEEEAVLRALGRATIVLRRAADADLMREQRLPISEYMVLMHLSEVPERQLRMSDLAATCDLSLSGITRLVSRLAEQGLVARVRCAEDARGWHAVLTDAGLTRLRRAWPTHLASVRRHVFDHLHDIDLTQFARALESIAPDAPTTSGSRSHRPAPSRR